MRKYIIGAIFGIVVGLSSTAYADDVISLIGNKIQGQTTVYLDGQKLDTAIIVGGKSYGPIRKIAESSGKEVTFEEGEIYLKTPVSTEKTSVVPQNGGGKVVIPGTVEEIDKRIISKSNELAVAQKILAFQKKDKEDNPGSTEYDTAIKEQEEFIARLESDIASLKVKKAELEAQL